MHYRKATISDYDDLHKIRLAVKENVLVNTAAVTFDHYQEMLEKKGCGWVCENEQGDILGFSIIDLSRHNIWALFIKPGSEGKGIGQKLQQLMLDWFFSQSKEPVWLTTDPGTRAEAFYSRSCWERIGLNDSGEVRFEMKAENWHQTRNKHPDTETS